MKVRSLLIAGAILLTSSAWAEQSIVELKKEKRSLQSKINFSQKSIKLRKDPELQKLKQAVRQAEDAYRQARYEKLKEDPTLAGYFKALNKLDQKISEIKKTSR